MQNNTTLKRFDYISYYFTDLRNNLFFLNILGILLTCPSSFFFTLMGLLSSMSSSRLTLDATLESALITFEADTVVLPIRFEEMPVSRDELGVTEDLEML